MSEQTKEQVEAPKVQKAITVIKTDGSLMFIQPNFPIEANAVVQVHAASGVYQIGTPEAPKPE